MTTIDPNLPPKWQAVERLLDKVMPRDQNPSSRDLLDDGTHLYGHGSRDSGRKAAWPADPRRADRRQVPGGAGPVRGGSGQMGCEAKQDHAGGRLETLKAS